MMENSSLVHGSVLSLSGSSQAWLIQLFWWQWTRYQVFHKMNSSLVLLGTPWIYVQMDGHSAAAERLGTREPDLFKHILSIISI